ncbi:glycosyltransferase family 87 protein [Legionella septentrionalis]|uniref:DUF2029 domain-containing protein n=1 Tax=Legionella septentrionalis TaxID=2498109 RepID=A0A433JM15_9GAMM|nr:glycosyltransferase family 87 protein [Legionella septentrionalis]RUQ90370.1 DUF2029 domain-containing protein [Legionella septentrionalis]
MRLVPAFFKEKSIPPLATASFIAISSAYLVIFYFVFTGQYRMDFSSLYTASYVLHAGENPYQVLFRGYFPDIALLPANLNPPIILWLATPLIWLGFDAALWLWSFASLTLGVLGVRIVFKYAFPAEFYRKNQFYLYLLYFAFFPVAINTIIGQFGGILFFLTMYGYDALVEKKEVRAGLLWGILVSIKFFPGLLLLYSLSQKKYRTFIVMVATIALLLLIPWLCYGIIIYKHYVSMMSRVLWYGDSWNASFYGYLFRLWVDVSHYQKSWHWVKLSYVILFFLFLIFYLYQLGKQKDSSLKHKGFCLTLVMMLFMSPFGWMYYFSLLLFPLLLSWLEISSTPKPPRYLFLWLLAFFFLTFPTGYVMAARMESTLNAIGVYSFHFYGMLLLTSLIYNLKLNSCTRAILLQPYLQPVTLFIFAFSFLLFIVNFIVPVFAYLH